MLAGLPNIPRFANTASAFYLKINQISRLKLLFKVSIADSILIGRCITSTDQYFREKYEQNVKIPS